MRFNSTKEIRQQYANQLIEEAMLLFKQRVEIIKKHMDNKNVRIVNLHINAGNNYPESVYADVRMMAMDSSLKSSPAVETSTFTLTVTVSGSVQFF